MLIVSLVSNSGVKHDSCFVTSLASLTRDGSFLNPMELLKRLDSAAEGGGIWAAGSTPYPYLGLSEIDVLVSESEEPLRQSGSYVSLVLLCVRAVWFIVSEFELLVIDPKKTYFSNTPSIHKRDPLAGSHILVGSATKHTTKVKDRSDSRGEKC